MKNLRNMFAAILLVTVMSVTTTFAGDGILVAGFAGDDNPCVEEVKATTNSGILVAGFTGILVAGFTGILVAGFNGEESAEGNDTCGILVAG